MTTRLGTRAMVTIAPFTIPHASPIAIPIRNTHGIQMCGWFSNVTPTA